MHRLIVALRSAIPVVFPLLLVVGCAATQAQTFTSFPNPPVAPATAAMTTYRSSTQSVVLAGGCFWGIQGVFERLKGVENTVAGYSGGTAATAHYNIVSTGTTGHAESVKITYDPAVISFGTILKVFFSVAMNPTELDYQGPDHGTQYRSVVFYENPQQRWVAEHYIEKLDTGKVFSKPIVTQVVPLQAFYRAETYHQHFMDKNPDYPYIVFWDKPKVEHLNQLYPNLVNHQYRYKG